MEVKRQMFSYKLLSLFKRNKVFGKGRSQFNNNLFNNTLNILSANALFSNKQIESSTKVKI